MKKKIFIYLLMLCTVSAAYSIDKNKYSFGISTGQTMYSTFKHYQVPDSFAINFVGVSLESFFNNSFSLELGYQYYLNKDKFSAPLNHSAEMMLNYYTNNNYLFPTDAFLSPYIALGLGYHQTYAKVEDSRQDFFSGVGKVGLNLRWNRYFSTQVTLKSEGPVVAFDNSEFFKSEYLYNSFSVSLKYNFGKPAKKEFVAPVFYVGEKMLTDFHSQEDLTDSINVDDEVIFRADKEPQMTQSVDTVSDDFVEIIEASAPKAKKRIRINENGGRLHLFIDDGDDFQLEYNKNNLNVISNDSVVIDDKRVGAKSNILADSERELDHRDTIVRNLTKEQYYRLRNGGIEKNDTSKTYLYVNEATLGTPPENNYGISVKAMPEVSRVDTVYLFSKDTVYLQPQQPAQKEMVKIVEREMTPRNVENSYQRRLPRRMNSYYSRSDYNYQPVNDNYSNQIPRKNVVKDNSKKEPLFTRIKRFFTGKPAKSDDLPDDDEVVAASSYVDKVELEPASIQEEIEEEVALKIPQKDPSKNDFSQEVIKEQQDSIRVLINENERLNTQLEKQQKEVQAKNSVKDHTPSALITVHYENGQVQLSNKNRKLIQSKMNELLRASQVLVEGYTDKSGTEAVNIKVSNQRIDDVVKYLLNSGVKANKIVRKAYGEKFAVFAHSIEERKVVIKVK